MTVSLIVANGDLVNRTALFSSLREVGSSCYSDALLVGGRTTLTGDSSASVLVSTHYTISFPPGSLAREGRGIPPCDAVKPKLRIRTRGAVSSSGTAERTRARCMVAAWDSQFAYSMFHKPSISAMKEDRRGTRK